MVLQSVLNVTEKYGETQRRNADCSGTDRVMPTQSVTVSWCVLFKLTAFLISP